MDSVTTKLFLKNLEQLTTSSEKSYRQRLVPSYKTVVKDNAISIYPTDRNYVNDILLELVAAANQPLCASHYWVAHDKELDVTYIHVF